MFQYTVISLSEKLELLFRVSSFRAVLRMVINIHQKVIYWNCQLLVSILRIQIFKVANALNTEDIRITWQVLSLPSPLWDIAVVASKANADAPRDF